MNNNNIPNDTFNQLYINYLNNKLKLDLYYLPMLIPSINYDLYNRIISNQLETYNMNLLQNIYKNSQNINNNANINPNINLFNQVDQGNYNFNNINNDNNLINLNYNQINNNTNLFDNNQQIINTSNNTKNEQRKLQNNKENFNFKNDLEFYSLNKKRNDNEAEAEALKNNDSNNKFNFLRKKNTHESNKTYQSTIFCSNQEIPNVIRPIPINMTNSKISISNNNNNLNNLNLNEDEYEDVRMNNTANIYNSLYPNENNKKLSNNFKKNNILKSGNNSCNRSVFSRYSKSSNNKSTCSKNLISPLNRLLINNYNSPNNITKEYNNFSTSLEGRKINFETLKDIQIKNNIFNTNFNNNNNYSNQNNNTFVNNDNSNKITKFNSWFNNNDVNYNLINNVNNSYLKDESYNNKKKYFKVINIGRKNPPFLQDKGHKWTLIDINSLDDELLNNINNFNEINQMFNQDNIENTSYSFIHPSNNNNNDQNISNNIKFKNEGSGYFRADSLRKKIKALLSRFVHDKLTALLINEDKDACLLKLPKSFNIDVKFDSCREHLLMPVKELYKMTPKESKEIKRVEHNRKMMDKITNISFIRNINRTFSDWFKEYSSSIEFKNDYASILKRKGPIYADKFVNSFNSFLDYYKIKL